MSEYLKKGSIGPKVIELQKKLTEVLRLRPGIRSDGIFGPATASAVRALQARYGLAIDGIVGAATWRALTAKTRRATSPVPPPGTAAGPAWMAIASKELGQVESVGAMHNPRILAYHGTTSLNAGTDETPWCSSFVNWCLKQAGVAGTDSAAAASWMGWGEKSLGRVGAITVIYNSGAANSSLSSTGNHVGFLIDETGKSYRLLGGNQSDSVKVSSFPKSAWLLKGFRWPKGNP